MKNKFLAIGIFITIVSILITVNVIFHETLSRDLAASYNRQQVLIATGIANSIKTDIEEHLVQIELITDILSYYSAKEITRIDNVFTDLFMREFATAFDVTIFDFNGLIVATTNPSGSPKLPTRFGDFFKLDQTTVFNDLDQIYAISPIRGETVAMGWILINMPIREIARKHMPFFSLDHGHAWLLDHSGNLVVHPTAKDMLANNIYNASAECFDCHTSFDLSRKVLDGNPVEAGRYTSPSKEEKILAFSRFSIGEESWIVVVASPYAKVVASAQNSMRTYSWLVVAIFSTFFFGSSIFACLIRKSMLVERVANEALLIEHKKLDTIVSAIGAGLILLDQDHRITWANDTVQEWGEELLGRPWSEICPSCSSPDEEDGRVSQVVCKGLFNKKIRVFQVTTAPINNAQGETIAVLKLIQDVSEIKTMEERIAQTEKLSALGRVAAGIAHEIGNPLTSISSFVQILKERAEDDFARENFDRIEHNIQRIIKILQLMSRFSKIPEMEIQDHNINDTINSSIEIVKFDKKLERITLRAELAPDLPRVRFDDGKMVQVFINLILNAADAIGDSDGTIIIRTFSNNNRVFVQVSDNGHGMPEDVLGCIFDPFFTTKVKGTGLGLSISHEIVKKFGGDLCVESHEGDGSVFSVILPVNQQGAKNG